jgi:hypothetical protein
MLAERLDVPMPLPGTPEQAWQALLLGESARAGEPAQNEKGGAGLAIDRDAPRSPSYSSDLSPNPSPSQKLSPFGAPGRTALVSR